MKFRNPFQRGREDGSRNSETPEQSAGESGSPDALPTPYVPVACGTPQEYLAALARRRLSTCCPAGLALLLRLAFPAGAQLSQLAYSAHGQPQANPVTTGFSGPSIFVSLDGTIVVGGTSLSASWEGMFAPITSGVSGFSGGSIPIVGTPNPNLAGQRFAIAAMGLQVSACTGFLTMTELGNALTIVISDLTP